MCGGGSSHWGRNGNTPRSRYWENFSIAMLMDANVLDGCKGTGATEGRPGLFCKAGDLSTDIKSAEGDGRCGLDISAVGLLSYSDCANSAEIDAQFIQGADGC